MTKEEIDYFLIEEHFLKLCRWIAEVEREACAKIADEWVLAYPHPSKAIAEQIRKRGQE